MAAFRPAVLGSRALGIRPVVFSRTRLPARPVRPLALVCRNMGSSKGKPTDPELREKVVEGEYRCKSDTLDVECSI